MYTHFKRIASSSPTQTPPLTPTEPPLFQAFQWGDVQTIVASEGSKFGVYFLAANHRDYADKVNVSVVKIVQNPGDEMFSYLLGKTYGLNMPTSKLLPIEPTQTAHRVEELSRSSNPDTVAGSTKFSASFSEIAPRYLFMMAFINGKGLDSIDNDNEKVHLFKQKEFLKMLGYALPFDALICNGDRFNILHPDEFTNFGNMVLESDGEFVAIDNGINALGVLADYQDVPLSHYRDILREIVSAVASGDQAFIDRLADSIARSISSECPKLKLEKTEKAYIANGIVAGILRLREMSEESVRAIFDSIPADSAKTETSLAIVLDSLQVLTSAFGNEGL